MKKLLVLLVLLSGCASYQSLPIDKCCETDVVYLDELQDGTTIFTNYDNYTIRFDYKPLRPNLYLG